MKFFVFGTGKFYEYRKERLRLYMEGSECIGFLDNHRTGIFGGRTVYPPEQGIRQPFDKILLMSASAQEMCEQLLELGVPTEKILPWEEFRRGHDLDGELHVYAGKDAPQHGKKLLIVTEGLAYNGGALAAVYAGLVLQARGWQVTLATSFIDEELLAEVQERGLTVIKCPSLPYIFSGERAFLRWFDIVLVNVFPMMVSAIEISQFHPVLWWIHDPSLLYPMTFQRFPNYVPRLLQFQGRALAVSSIAAQNFQDSGRIEGLLPYGIPDTALPDGQSGDGSHGICFALIGTLEERKAQDVFLDAVSLLPHEESSACKFLIIGGLAENDYVRLLREKAMGLPEVNFTGKLTRAEMEEAFRQIDVVVCPSLEDPLPIVVTEGMMHHKICIASDATGQAQDIIRDGENGFICKAGDAASLAEKMAYVIEHFDELDPMREKARETYERYFSMEAFGERLERELLLTEREYWEREKKG